MRIIDIDGNEVLEPDCELGYLVVESVLVAHHDAEPEKPYVEEEGEPIWQDEDDPRNALVPVRVVQEYEPAKEAWDEREEVLRYVPYTAAELAERKAEKEAEEATRKKGAELAAARKKLQEEREAIVDSVPAILAVVDAAQLDQDDAIAELYESTAKAQLDADEAIAALYETMTTRRDVR